jgi:glycosyltransferase involved in cell wall biosynthesis
MPAKHVVVMVASSYPRFPGDGIGSFMEPIAKGVAARGHEVHLVAPWHPLIRRGTSEDGVFFHFYRYAPIEAMNVFGYASGLRADTTLKAEAWLAAPSALAAGWFKAWRVAQKRHATVMHAHWVIPGGVTGALAAGSLPLVVSLHGSDVYVAEHHALAGRAARAVFGRASWVTACSDDLRTRALALGARASASETVPYGVDTARFGPRPEARRRVREVLGATDGPLIVSAGRLVRKKGFEYLIDAAALLAPRMPTLRVAIAGDGDLRDELTHRAATAGNVRLLGSQSQDAVADLLAAGDIAVIPSVHDEAGNVDGLPNFALEAMASATPVIATRAGGLAQLIDDGRDGALVAERDSPGLANAIEGLLARAGAAHDMGEAARAKVIRQFGWSRVAERFEHAYGIGRR